MDASSGAAAGPLRLLVDLNIVLDVVLKREPWYRDAVGLFDAMSGGAAEGYVASHAIATLYFLVNKANGRMAAVTAVTDLLSICEVAPMGRQDFQRALALGFADFEDAVQVAVALRRPAAPTSPAPAPPPPPDSPASAQQSPWSPVDHRAPNPRASRVRPP